MIAASRNIHGDVCRSAITKCMNKECTCVQACEDFHFVVIDTKGVPAYFPYKTHEQIHKHAQKPTHSHTYAHTDLYIYTYLFIFIYL